MWVASSVTTTLRPPLAKAPFDDKQAHAHQDVWAAHLGMKVETENTIGMRLVLIPPGEYLMGSTDEQVSAATEWAKPGSGSAALASADDGERPQHKVTITKPFLMGATEVTIGQFGKFVAAAKYVTDAERYGFVESDGTVLGPNVREESRGKNWRNIGDPHTDDMPARYLSWNDATAFCKWLSGVEHAAYRLPTEAEWEYACRAGTTTLFSFGDDRKLLSKYEATTKLSPVAAKLPNSFRLYDMHRSLSEFCGDYHDLQWYQKSPDVDPTGPAQGGLRVSRGGNWVEIDYRSRSAVRGKASATARSDRFGFRVVRVIEVPKGTPLSPASGTK